MMRNVAWYLARMALAGVVGIGIVLLFVWLAGQMDPTP